MNKPPLTPEQRRLATEIELLRRVEAQYGLLKKPIIDQLVYELGRPLPDAPPRRPGWTYFKWPVSGVLDYTGSRRSWSPWMGEEL